ncbi:MAG: hypothetical protein FJ254_03625 [Phycisphaerae bacterium]|nr:hypothetical protein [Phycisphaerae bacterium]
MMRSILIVLVFVAACATVREPAPAATAAVAKELPGPWAVIEGRSDFFKAESVLFSPDGRIRITRDGKIRRGTWAMVDGMLEVKGVEQTARFGVASDSDGLLLRPLTERKGAWCRTDAEVSLRAARVLPTTR